MIMNTYIQYLFYLLRQCVAPMTITVSMCLVIIAVSFFAFRRHPFRQNLLKSEITLSLLACYITLALCVTLTRGGAARQFNTHLFRAFREMWNTFSLQNWLNLILNVGFFIPIGILLPLVTKKFRHLWLVTIIGFLFSLGIEATQFLTKTGIFDVDDLLTNTVGCIIGYCITMSVLTIAKKAAGTAWVKFGYMGTILAGIIAVISIYAVYILQPYGNLEDAWSYKVNTNHVTWNLSCALHDEKTSAYVFQTQSYNQASADEFAENMLNKLGIQDNLDVYHYDMSADYINYRVPGYTLHISYLDGGYTLSYHYPINEHEPVWSKFDQEKLLNKLSEFGITIPNDVTIEYGEHGWHTICLNLAPYDTEIWHGTLRVRYAEENNIIEIENNLIRAAPCKEEQMITMTEAYQRLCKGYFSGDYFCRIAPSCVEVLSCSLEYQIDSKSYLQPVYIFNLMLDNQYESSVMIPALK